MNRHRAKDFLLNISPTQWQVFLWVVLFIYLLSLLAESLNYSADARLFPLFVGIAIGIGIMIRIVMLVAQDKIPFQFGGFFDDMAENMEQQVDISDPDDQKWARYKRELAMIGWIMAMVLMAWFLGFLLTVLLYPMVFSFYYGRNLPASIVTGVILFSIVYLIFITILSTPLWEGVWEPLSHVL